MYSMMGAPAHAGGPEEGSPRAPDLVLRDHLILRRLDALETDIARNYDPGVVLFCGDRLLRGHDGVRQSAQLLVTQLPDATYEYGTIRVEQDLGFVEWTARARGASVSDGTDSFLIRNGRILVQTIHYSAERRHGRLQSPIAGGLVCLGVAALIARSGWNGPPGNTMRGQPEREER